MRLKEMEIIFNYISNDLKPENIKEWVNYKNNMEKFFKELKPYYEEDDKKEYKSITEEDYERISKIFDDVAKASDELMKAYANIEEKTVDKDGKPIPKVGDIVKNLNDQFFSKGYVEYKNIKPNPNVPLKDQLDNFRDLFVKLSNQEVKKLGGNQSSRLQMNVDLDGKEVKGVFTEKIFNNGKDDFEKIFKALAEKYPKYKDFYESFDPKSFFEKETFSYVDLNNLMSENGEVDDELRELIVKNFFVKSAFGQKVTESGAAFSKDEDFYNSLLDFAAQISNISNNLSFNKEIGIVAGERLDVRNSAMSAVATLIKVPDLIAKSRNLAVYDEAGKKITEGTFMEFAKGKDINNIAPVDEMRLMKNQNFESYLVKKQLANLQVLDYICGNVDRHGGNMLYDVDPVSKNLKGIVGIDNDCSFGTSIPDINKKQQRLPSINDMRVISEDMANTIKNLTEGELKSTLHGYGLSQKTIDAAWERTKQLQNAIQNGKKYQDLGGIANVDPLDKRPCITIMSDEDFKNVNLAYCAGRTNNYFDTLEGIKTIATTRDYENKNLSLKSYALLKGFKSAVSKEQTQDFVNKSKTSAPKWFASKRYKNFMAKLDSFHNTNIKGEDPLSPENKAKYDKLDELKNAIEVYKREKIRDGFIDDKWNLKKNVTGKDLDRILLVKDTEKYVNRIEKEKALTLDMKLRHEEDIKKVNGSIEFFGKNKNEQIKLVEDKLKAEGVDLSKKDENAIEAKAFVDNDNIVVKKVGKVLVFIDKDDPEDESFFENEEEIDNNNIVVNNKEAENEL